jgi:hypothetical protein
MIFDLIHDLADILRAMPAQHRRRRILKLLDEAIRRDAHFIDKAAPRRVSLTLVPNPIQRDAFLLNTPVLGIVGAILS